MLAYLTDDVAQTDPVNEYMGPWVWRGPEVSDRWLAHVAIVWVDCTGTTLAKGSQTLPGLRNAGQT